jgi:hypothetical protein
MANSINKKKEKWGIKIESTHSVLTEEIHHKTDGIRKYANVFDLKLIILCKIKSCQFVYCRLS